MKKFLRVFLLVVTLLTLSKAFAQDEIRTEVVYPADTANYKIDSVGVYVNFNSEYAPNDGSITPVYIAMYIYKDGINTYGTGTQSYLKNDGERLLMPFYIPNHSSVIKPDSFAIEIYLSEGIEKFYDKRVLYPKITKPLPVTLTSFEVREQNNQAVLYWETGIEKNTHYFQVEESPNAIEFRTIGNVNANGNTNTQTSYSFVDYNVKPKYYRLKITDYDNTFSYSPIISLRINDKQETVYYFQINKKMVQIRHNGTDRPKSLVLYNLHGNQIYKSLINGSDMIRVNGISEKVIIINMVTKRKIYSKKLVVE